MKNLTFFVLLLASNFVAAQQSLSGLVKDAKTGDPLPFANIVTNTNIGTITDIDGKFELSTPRTFDEVTISYVGFDAVVKKIDGATTYLEVSLQPNVESLGEVVLTAEGVNPALAIIKSAIDNKKNNDPQKLLRSFKHRAYNKLLVTANPDSIVGSIDSVFTKKPDGELVFKSVDSSNYNFKKDITRSHIYVTEKAAEVSFNKSKGRREKVMATRMAGLKEPIYEVLALQLQSISFYKNTYTIFGTEYTNPIANNALSKYNYKILDTVTNAGRDAYMIYYKPKKKGKVAGLEGVLYVDMKSFALQKAIAQLKAIVDVKATQNYEYQPQHNVWFPTVREIKMARGENNEKIALFGGNVTLSNSENGASRDSTIVTTHKQDESDFIYLIATEKNFDIKLNQEVSIKGRGLTVEYDEKAHDRDEDFWNRYRTDSITQRGRETYKILDSIVEKENIEKNIKLARKLLQGYYPTKYVDIDLRNLVKYNNYEAFRLGIGGVTTADFSPKYRLNGYVVYGTRDQEFKFGVGGAVRLDKYTNTWFGGMYIDDLRETGSSAFITDRRMFSIFEPRLFNITLFDKTRSISAYLEHEITPKLQAKLQVTKSEEKPTYDYQYTNDGVIYNTYTLGLATVSFQWNPFSEYIQSRQGRIESKVGYPKFSFQLTKSFDGFLDGDFDFSKAEFRALHQIKRLNKSTTSFLLEAGMASGELPLSNLYHTSPNNPVKDRLLQRFSVAGRNSFETMYFGEFFSNRYAALHLKHSFTNIKLGKINPELVLISRFAIGNAKDQQNHLGVQFDTLENGYFESGFELNKLFWGFGISGAYRYGAYHLPSFEDNLSLKFTYYFSFGF